MRTLLRAGFAALLLLGLAGHALRAGRGEAGADPAAVLTARLAQLRIAAEPLPNSSFLLGHSPLCREPLLVGLLRADGADDEAARQWSRPGVAVKYVYLGAVADSLAGTDRAGRLGWATLRFHLGLRDGKPPAEVVMVAFQRSCLGLAGVDWAALSPEG
jgi:hypothetical protein